MRWLNKFVAGICFHGVTPKTNRFSEVVLLGMPALTKAVPVTPALTKDNCILVEDWGDEEIHSSFVSETRRRLGLRSCRPPFSGIVANADRDYRDGWSPMGQAKQILKWFDLH